MKKILVTYKLPGNYLNEIKNYEVKIRPENENPEKWLLNNIKDAYGILITLMDKIDREIIDHAENLKVISTYSVGYDHIDVKYALSKGIRVTNTPEVLSDSTADMIFGLMIAIARRLVEGDKLIRNNKWEAGWYPEFMLGTDVHGLTIGIVGMGRIGRAILKRAHGFDMRCIYYSRHKHDVDAQYVDIDELLKKSDYVVLCMDYNSETHHFMDYDKFLKMKKSAFIINGTRGKVINENDLIKALNNKIINGAALDVFENEPLKSENPLTKMDNVIVTPHLGSATKETRDKMAYVAVKNLINTLSGNEPLYEIKI